MELGFWEGIKTQEVSIFSDAGIQYGEEQTLTLQPDDDSGWDAYLQSNQADTPHDTADLAWGKHGDAGWRVLIAFDLSSIPSNAKINSAILSIYVDGDFSSNDRTVRVFRLKRPWIESLVTQNSFSTGTAWQSAGAFGANDCEQMDVGSRDFNAGEATGEMKDFVLTPTVKSNLDLGYGWLIKSDTEVAEDGWVGGSSAASAAQRPRLVVTYQVPVGSEIAYSQQIIFDGDSLTKGHKLSWKWNYPRQCLEGLEDGGETFEEINLGVDSQLLSTMLSDAPTNVDPLYNGGYEENIVVVWGGTNDLYAGGNSTGTYNNVVNYCQGRQSAGFKVVVLTALPRSNVGTPEGFEAERQALNTNIRNNYASFADTLADVAADSRIGDSGDELDTNYYQDDKVHLNEIGACIVAGIVKTVIEGIL